MSIFNVLTPSIYGILLVLWAYILCSSLIRLVRATGEPRHVRTLLTALVFLSAALAIECIFFGIRYASSSGFIDPSINVILEQPHITFIPKAFHVVAVGMAVLLLVRRWYSQERKDRDDADSVRERLEESVTRSSSALRESEARFRSLVDVSPDGIIVAQDDRLVFVNAALVRMLGYDSPDDLIGKRVFDLIHPDFHRTVADRIETVQRDDVPVPPAYEQYIRRDGSPIDVEVVGSPIVYNGRPAGQAILRDVTTRRRAEDALRRSEEQFRALIENSQDCVTLHDAEGVTLYVSPSVQAVFGYEPGELGGQNRPELFHPDDWPLVESGFFGLAGRHRAVATLEYRLRHKRGDWRWVHGEAVNLLEDPAVQAIVVNFRDVTERKLAVQSLTERVTSETLVSNMARRFLEIPSLEIDHAMREALGTVGTQLKCDMVHVSQRLGDSMTFRLTHIWVDEETPLPGEFQFDYDGTVFPRLFENLRIGSYLLIANVDELPEDAASVKLAISAIGGKSFVLFPVHLNNVLEGGLSLVWRTRLSEATDAQLAPLVVLSNVMLAALRKAEAEQAVRVSEERFRAIVQSVSDMNLVLDANASILYESPSVERILGYERGHLLGKTPRDIVHPDELHQIMRELGEIAGGVNAGIPTEFRLRHADGTWLPVEAVASNLIDHPAVGGIVVTIRDVSDRQRAQEERARLEEQMQQAQKLESLGILAGGIAHDFNNLLVGILGNADLASAELPLAAPARSYLQDISKAAQRAAELCRQMLAYSGRGRFVVEPADLNLIVREMGQLLDVSISKLATVRYDLAPVLPTILADSTQLRQVIMNLITNASDALGEASGLITVRTGFKHFDREYLANTFYDDNLVEGEYVFVEVADTGCGMDEETLNRIFDPFYTTKFTGRGLGLAAVLGIVRGHKGAIKVYSEHGRGTSFRVLFPAHLEWTSQPQSRLEEPTKWHTEGIVLVIDDEPAVRTVAQRILGTMGLDVIPAVDGVEGVELFQENAPNIVCVLLDLTMPRMNGEDAFRELRRIRKDVPIILTSGYNEQEVSSRFAGRRFSAFIQKPFQMAELAECVRRVLGGEPTNSPPASAK